MSTKVDIQTFGKTADGQAVQLYTLQSKAVEFGVINYGAALLFIKITDKFGHIDDIITGFESLSEYTANRTYFGASIGRVANRIAKGKFILDDKEYSLPINNGPNSLHGGNNGFDKKLWDGKIDQDTVIFKLTSPDEDEGYPGQLEATITYKLIGNELAINYYATCNKSTPVNLTNHSFFNLGGHDNWDKDLSNHEIMIPAEHYLPVDENCLCTGEIVPVKDSIFDLRSPVTLTEAILSKVPSGLGFDHNFCLNRSKDRHLAAIVKHKVNGRIMTVETTEPGVQLYTGNFLAGLRGKKGVAYTKHSALCLESQNWPDAINHVGVFPDCVLRPGEEYSHSVWFRFDVC